MYCKRCGAKLSDEHKFCNWCGCAVHGDHDHVKEQQLKNERDKRGCMTLGTGAFVSAVLLFTVGPVFAGISLLIWMVIALVEGSKKD